MTADCLASASQPFLNRNLGSRIQNVVRRPEGINGCMIVLSLVTVHGLYTLMLHHDQTGFAVVIGLASPFNVLP